ncbi:MAG: response regulator transcription factor [Dehalococcoidia bacterium]|nr:response regulator transcription factor [Dehalococcoidia bacterium]
MAPITLVIADDHALFREGLRLLLEQTKDIVVAGEAADGQEAVDLVARLQPDLVVLDISMPRVDGLEAARRIRARSQVPILFLTVHDTENYFFDALEAGASGYVLKDAVGADLITALHVVYGGGVYLSPSVAKRLVEDYLSRVARGEEMKSYDALTPREREVLELVGQGLTNQEIAERLVLSVNTVQTHRLHVMEKLNIHNRAQLMKFAVRLGLLKAPPT